MIEDHLTRGLKSKDVAERRRVVELLENTTVFNWVSDRDERDISAYIPALAEALSDEDKGVRDGAMSAIFSAQGDRQDVQAAVPAMLSIIQAAGDAQFKKRAVLFIREEVKNGLDIASRIGLFKGMLAVSGQDDMTLGASDTLALYYIKKKDWSSVDALLRHTNVEVRQEVVGTIDHSYASDIPQTTMEILVSFLADVDDELPLVTALALAPHGRGKADIERIGRVLLVHARHVDPKHSNTAISGIARLMERTITCSNGLPRTEWGPLRPLVDFMHDLLQCTERSRSETAAKVLVEYHSHAGEWDAVNKLMLDARPEIRAASLDHLCHCGYMDCKIDATAAIPAIIELLPGDRDTLRIISNRIRDRHLQLPVLEAAIRASKLSVDEAWPYLDKIMEAQPDWKLREAEKKLASLDKQDKLAFVLNVANSRHGEPRRWAIHQVGNLHSFEKVPIKKAIPDLVMFLADTDPFIRAEAASVIGFMSLHYDTAGAMPYLVNLLGDRAGKIQQNAAMALAAMADKGDDISASLDALATTLLRSSQADARAQAAIAFYNLARRGADLERFHETIVQGLKDTNKPTRDFCTWAITQYIMNKTNAKQFLELLSAASIESTSDVAIQIGKKAQLLSEMIIVKLAASFLHEDTMKSTTKPIVTTHQIDALVKKHFGMDAAAGKIQELTGGWFNAAYRVEVPAKNLDMVLKVSPAPGAKIFTYEQKAMETEVAMLRLLAKHPAIPVPKLHAVDFDGDIIPSKCFFMDFLTGTPWNAIRKEVSRDNHVIVEKEFAAIQMAINAIKGEYFGFLERNDDGRINKDSWYGAFSELVAILLDDYTRFGIKAPPFATKVIHLLPEYEPSFRVVTAPSLVHWDLWEGNIFLEKRVDGYHVQGITDFERALWADPYIEVSFWTPKRHAALVDCYGRSEYEARDVQVRRAFYDLYLSAIMYLEQYTRGYTWLFSKSIRVFSLLRARQALKQLRQLL